MCRGARNGATLELPEQRDEKKALTNRGLLTYILLRMTHFAAEESTDIESQTVRGAVELIRVLRPVAAKWRC